MAKLIGRRGRARILTGGNRGGAMKTTGTPGFVRVTARRFTGLGKISGQDTAGRFGGVRKLIARDPTDAKTGENVPRMLGKVTPAAPATLTTALAGANNDMKFTARTPGVGGNSIRVAIVVAGASTPLSVAVAGNDITVNSATSAGSAATSTANDVVAAVKASATASPLVQVELASGNDGTGVVAAQALTNLTGGAAPVTTPARATNTVGPQSPAMVKAAKQGNSTPVGQSRAVARPNRSLRRR